MWGQMCGGVTETSSCEAEPTTQYQAAYPGSQLPYNTEMTRRRWRAGEESVEAEKKGYIRIWVCCVLVATSLGGTLRGRFGYDNSRAMDRWNKWVSYGVGFATQTECDMDMDMDRVQSSIE